MKYELINEEGCLFDSITVESLEEAEEYFTNEYEGEFIIICAEIDQRKKVVL